LSERERFSSLRARNEEKESRERQNLRLLFSGVLFVRFVFDGSDSFTLTSAADDNPDLPINTGVLRIFQVLKEHVSLKSG
jgi:hypothetical protein